MIKRSIKNTLYLLVLLSGFFLTGCGSDTIYYIEPEYAKIKTVAKIPQVSIEVQDDGTTSAEDTKKLVDTLRAHLIKENYYDTNIYNWNIFADKQNKKAVIHNTEVQKELEGGFFDFFK